MKRIKKALIIGGGIAGPVAALALRRAGIDSVVCEARREPADGAGNLLALAPNGLAALGIVGVDRAVLALGQPIRTMVMADGRGKRLGVFPGLVGLPPNLAISRSELGRVLLRALPIYAITAAAGMAVVILMGYSSFAPKWTSLFLLFAPINLFFTCLAEEAFFRGFVQHELASIGARRALAAGIALVAAAVLFGLAHFAGGLNYVIAAAIAGLGYGWAFMRDRRIEAAMLVHFGVNATHFLLFVSPRLA